MEPITIVWLHKDLRLRDNPALLVGSRCDTPVLPLFILDPSLKAMGSAQEWWLHNSLLAYDESLRRLGSRLVTLYGRAEDVFARISQTYRIKEIHWNRGYAPDLIEQQARVADYCEVNGIKGSEHVGNLLLDPTTVMTKQGSSFSVYTPFWNAVNHSIIDKPLPAPQSMPLCPEIPQDDLGLKERQSHWSGKFHGLWEIGEAAAQKRFMEFVAQNIAEYHRNRDYPSVLGTSRLSSHLHFGEISVRDMWHTIKVQQQISLMAESSGPLVFLKELVWREFCYHLLFHNPKMTTDNFRKDFQGFPWIFNELHFKAWTRGETGYPIVDAGMRQLWATGWMHNRVRMIVASFLTKNLLIDWRYGEEWFWDTLVDADQASNVANWQWVAGCGADAAPYFRIFNPTLQSEKFDPKGDYIREWVPEIAHLSDKQIHSPVFVKGYPRPLVDLHVTRERALRVYKEWRSRPGIVPE